LFSNSQIVTDILNQIIAMDYILLVVLILMSGYYSGLEMGIYCLNRVRLQHRTSRGWRTAKIIGRHLKDPPSLICTLLVGNNIVNFAVAALFTGILEKMTSLAHAELFATIILSPILLIFGEVTPKNLFLKKSDSLFYSLAPTIDISRKLFYPIVILLRLVSKAPLIFFEKSRSPSKSSA
jgi:Mg2+/Co2+ transporter CorB